MASKEGNVTTYKTQTSPLRFMLETQSRFQAGRSWFLAGRSRFLAGRYLFPEGRVSISGRPVLVSSRPGLDFQQDSRLAFRQAGLDFQQACLDLWQGACSAESHTGPPIMIIGGYWRTFPKKNLNRIDHLWEDLSMLSGIKAVKGRYLCNLCHFLKLSDK